MFKTEQEYLVAKKRLEQDLEIIKKFRIRMRDAGFTETKINVAIAILSPDTLPLVEKVFFYEKIKG